jgi:recombination protein RecA
MDAVVKGASISVANSEKAKALQAALAQIEKQFGKGTIMRLGEGEALEDIQVVSTGSLGLDIALGVGGLPRGRVIEIYGPESSGKTTLTLQVIAAMQKQAGTCAFVDAEHALDVQYAQKLGVNLSDLLISQPDTGEQALEIVDSLVRSGAVDLIVIDSVAALTPKAEIEGEMGDSLPGLQARLMSQALRKLTATIKKTNCMVIFINQIVDKSGAWYAYNGEKIGQGRDNAREFLRENPELSREIENKVRESLGIPLLAADAGSEPEKAEKPAKAPKADKAAAE